MMPGDLLQSAPRPPVHACNRKRKGKGRRGVISGGEAEQSAGEKRKMDFKEICFCLPM